MNDMMIFNNPGFGEVRTMEEDGKVLFCGADVARTLGYSNPTEAISRHCKGVVKRDTPTAGGVQPMAFISEPDLYRLVFRSKLPNAEAFADWVTEEVIPSIRKTGGYQIYQAPELELPHQWMKRGTILGEDAEKELGLKKGKIRDLLVARPTVYVNGVDWETLRGNALSEYKFYNRVGTPGKHLLIIYESGWKKLRWEVLGLGTPDAAMLPAPEVPALPAAMAAKQEKMERGLEQIAMVIQELIK